MFSFSEQSDVANSERADDVSKGLTEVMEAVSHDKKTFLVFFA